MDIDAKYVRTLAPAGSTANFTSIAGNSHRYFWLSIDLIEALLEQGIKVFEKLKVQDANGNSEIELTLQNFNSNNNGIEYDDNEVVVKDHEAIRAKELKESKEEDLKNIGLEIKKAMDKRMSKFTFTASGESMIEEDGEF